MTKLETQLYQKAWRARNKDKIAADRKVRYARCRIHDLRVKRNYYSNNKVKISDYSKNRHQRLKENPEYVRKRNAYFMDYYYANHSKRKSYSRNRNLSVKKEVLTHYSGGSLKCCWHECEVSDIDVLTLDHVDNSGGLARKNNEGCGLRLYARLKRQRFPIGFQTLCANHQMKKEILRKRSLCQPN